ncbi:GrpB family protein [Lysinibacillus sp. NPDC093216]|uniref:GrpB family protein n=1 Tax=Lysinibacillus sp. NPDC093216 TaxID=3390576 RepID=UPI003D01A74D
MLAGTSHLHICEYNSTEWNEKCLFRDYLRENLHAANEYASLKEQLKSHPKMTLRMASSYIFLLL